MAWPEPSLRTDVLVAVVAIGVSLLGPLFGIGEDGRSATLLSVTVILVSGAVLVGRTRWPLVVLLLTAGLRLVGAPGSGDEVAAYPIVAVALFTVAAQLDDRRRRLVIASTVAVVSAIVVSIVAEDVFLTELPGELALLMLPVAIGDAVRSRSDRLDALVDTEAASRVQAERLRIARDLHDVVAHGLSSMTVRAGLAAHLAEKDPDQAVEALHGINATGKRALDDLRSMVGVLRAGGAIEPGAPLVPVPWNPDDLSTIVADVRAAGVEVIESTNGAFPADASEGAIVAFHRIVQEALANVVRHGGGAPAELTVDHRPAQVEVVIANVVGPGGSPDDVSTGVGIVGMRERAEAIGGTLQAEPQPNGRFEVRAVLPYRNEVA